MQPRGFIFNCRFGHARNYRILRPGIYLLNNPDVAAAGADPFIHFVLFGFAEHRSPHPLIDSSYIRSVDPYLISTTPDIEQLCDVLHYDLVDPSPYFDLKYYRGQLADDASRVTSLFQHFIQTGLPMGMKPSVLFDPAWYYRQLDGVHTFGPGCAISCCGAIGRDLRQAPCSAANNISNATPTWQMPDSRRFSII